MKYIQRLENIRTQRRGAFFVEPSSPQGSDETHEEDDIDGVSGQIGSLREPEPLPWDGMEDWDDDDNEEDHSLSQGDGVSPWEGGFWNKLFPSEDVDDNDDDFYNSDGLDRNVSNTGVYKGSASKYGPLKSLRWSASQIDNDDGSSIVDDQDTERIKVVLDDTGMPAMSLRKGGDPDEDEEEKEGEETGHVLKVEEEGRFGEVPTSKDPNVHESQNEIIVPEVWDADGVSQKGETGKQEYIEDDEEEDDDAKEEPKAETPLPSTNTVPDDKAQKEGYEKEDEKTTAVVPPGEAERPRLDQTALMAYEAEVEWLKKKPAAQRAWMAKHHLHHHHRLKSGYKEGEEDEDGVKDMNNPGESTSEDYASMRSPITDENLFDSPLWEYKHGGLNPNHDPHRKIDTHPSSKDRIEKEDLDKDEDGTVFPDIHSSAPYSKIVFPATPSDPTSALGYIAYNRQGDRIVDFSMVGWNEGNTDLPDPLKDVPVIEELQPRPEADSDADKGDDTGRIQKAINRAFKSIGNSVESGAVVPKGALVLARGIYRIKRPLKIQHSGLLFRGDPAGGSRIVCHWNPSGPSYAIEVQGEKDEMLDSTRIPVVSNYTPVGSFFLNLDPVYVQKIGLSVGDQVIVTRVGNSHWVESIGMDDFDTDKKGVKPWKKMRALMYRTIRSVNAQTGIVQLDAPLPISIQRDFGGGWITKYKDNKIRAIGIQFLDMVFPQNLGRSTDEMLDEQGRGSEDYIFSREVCTNFAIRVDNACHMYLSHITTAFFHNFISVGSDAHHLTMDSIVHSYPDEMFSGQSAFQLSGQLTLLKNSISQGSFHFFVHIKHIMGPNVVHRVQAMNVGRPDQPMPMDFAPGEVGPHMKFCTGILYDQIVTDGSIEIVNRGDMGTGQGFSGANSVIWNSRARQGILTHRARGFQNFVIGSEEYEAYDRHPLTSHGWKEHLGSEVLPGSLYLRQLRDRKDRLAKGWIS
ncbi:hypothetical protein BGX28_010164 [Mortierella sp. GBA30]|nr:hypothetical protein BGX28_010164 [Mortierella sp. GBA30]